MVEAGHEGDGVTAEIGLVMEGVLGVDEALAGFEGLLDESSAVFEDETDLKGGSAQHVEEFGGTRMIVRRGQTAGTGFTSKMVIVRSMGTDRG